MVAVMLFVLSQFRAISRGTPYLWFETDQGDLLIRYNPDRFSDWNSAFDNHLTRWSDWSWHSWFKLPHWQWQTWGYLDIFLPWWLLILVPAIGSSLIWKYRRSRRTPPAAFPVETG